MGKMSDLDLQIRELRSCGETIIEIANTLAGMFYSQAAEDAPPEEKPPHDGDCAGRVLGRGESPHYKIRSEEAVRYRPFQV